MTVIAPWGEPEFGQHKYEMPSGEPGDTFDTPTCSTKPTDRTCGPELAAHMYNYVRTACKYCTNVIAGDFGSDQGGGGTFNQYHKGGQYLRTYYKFLANAQDVRDWGVHPYNDVENAQQAYFNHRRTPSKTTTRVFSFATALASLNAKHKQGIHIWLDEISSFNGTGQGNHKFPYFTQDTQVAGAQYLFDTLVHAVPKNGPKVTNIYYLNFSGPTSANAELIQPPATPNPVYNTYKQAKG